MLRISLAFFVGLAASGCSPKTVTPIQQPSPPPAPAQTHTPIVLDAKYNAAVKTGVKKRLKDPGSARFTLPFRASEANNGVTTVCGLVNAKNSFGGYTGSAPFVGILLDSKNPAGFAAIAVGGTPSQQKITYQVCADARINLLP